MASEATGSTALIPAFVVPVEVRDCPQYGEGQKGVFAAAPVKAGTKVWEWTSLVKQIHHGELPALLAAMPRLDAQVFLRQGFVLPSDLEHFCTNPADAGRFTNHSATPTMGFEGTLRDIAEGEELTMDYSWHGNPEWYQELCKQYGTLTETQVANGETL